MKKNKRLTAVVISVIMVLLSTIPSAASKEQSDNYNFLLAQGYSSSFLDNLTEISMEKMVELIGDGYVSDITVEESTFSPSSSQTRGTINEGSLTIETTTSIICHYNTDDITGILVGANWEWDKNKPLYRGEDALVFNWDSDLLKFTDDSFFGVDLYKSNLEDEWSIFREYNVLAEIAQGGIGHTTDLKAFSKYVGGTVLFLLEPRENTMRRGTSHSSEISAQYAHAPIPLTGLTFGVYGVSVGLNWNLTCDTMATSSSFRYTLE